MKNIHLAVAALTVLLSAAVAGCGSSGGAGASGTTQTVGWNLTGLEPLGSGFEYEGWLIVNGSPVSTGRFSVDGAGVPAFTSAPISAAEANGATAFVLTIEPMMDPDPGPSATKLLAGDFSAGQATVTVGHAAALASDFLAAAGSFILATPSTTVTTDESQGIWWLDPVMGAPTLQLPVLPAGWSYEGWVVGASGPVSTGRFTNPAAADSDQAGPTSGMDSNGPPFPGQDFINPAMDLVGLTAVITVEPEPDDSASPFTLKPLVANPIGSGLAPMLQMMMNNAAATNPSGTVTIN